MCDSMMFPATVDEFMEKYKVVDSEHVYSNGMEMVPIFRMKQWFEHEANHNAEPGKMVDDAISRQAAIYIASGYCHPANIAKELAKLPSAEPKRETTTIKIGRSRNSVTMWYECEKCGEPVDQEDAFCRRCGRGIIHERSN